MAAASFLSYVSSSLPYCCPVEARDTIWNDDFTFLLLLQQLVGRRGMFGYVMAWVYVLYNSLEWNEVKMRSRSMPWEEEDVGRSWAYLRVKVRRKGMMRL